MDRRLILWSVLVCVPLWTDGLAGEKANIIVDVHGGGDFGTIQDALNSLPLQDENPVVILIRNGLYGEKVFIRRSHLSLVGEDRDSTRIVFPELRENWNKEHGGSDWGAGVVNIDTGTTDITLANLTVYNNYGWKNGVFNKHQFAIRGAGTRIVLLRCRVVSDGGDALSLWNRYDGMYYHAECLFEGWVDFVCPRGWCYVTRSTFFGHNKPSASIWHDGGNDRKQKLVITDSYFDGVPGFPLGRNHLDAQFYLVNCRFSRNMADRRFFRPPSSPREWEWGARHYFFNCHRDGGDFDWFRDNLNEAEGAPSAGQITAKWTFDGRWDPESSLPSVLPSAFPVFPAPGTRDVPATGVRLCWVAGRNADSHNISLGPEEPPEFIRNQRAEFFETGGLQPNTRYYWKVDEVTGNGVQDGQIWSFETGPDTP